MLIKIYYWVLLLLDFYNVLKRYGAWLIENIEQLIVQYSRINHFFLLVFYLCFTFFFLYFIQLLFLIFFLLSTFFFYGAAKVEEEQKKVLIVDGDPKMAVKIVNGYVCSCIKLFYFFFFPLVFFFFREVEFQKPISTKSLKSECWKMSKSLWNWLIAYLSFNTLIYLNKINNCKLAMIKFSFTNLIQYRNQFPL